MSDDRPAWAQRLTAERNARGWSQSDVVKALRAHAPKPLPSQPHLVRQWKRWEAGEHTPSAYYQSLIAAALGTVTRALFPEPGHRDGAAEVSAVSGMETLEIIQRLHSSDLDAPTLEALRITVDRLCSEYAYLPGEQLLSEGREWLQRLANLRSQRLTLSQHREVINLAGWLALLVGCVENDLGDRRSFEATRQAALSLGSEAENADVLGWAHEMRAWSCLTRGDYRGVIVAARTGTDIAPHRSVAVQLAAQEAKAWARIGDRRQTEVALDRGRKLLEGQDHPDNLDHHFVVDPSKFDFYAMDCYRTLGEDALAEALAHEVIRAGTDFDGTERSPMRIAEARITLGVTAVHSGDLDGALAYGRQALTSQRQSLPSLLMVSRELTSALREQHENEAATQIYLGQLHDLAVAAPQA
ncbi:hypothetical protein CLV92_102189 [Kineococcus xinjiangensis]|uniref:XRE family transcriptional regulator n=1 Tax=Kineococcus xinjiangensis TaxID=512762 RepID=A0A2S6IUX6_9ACTN|nr:hypothetical protein [Kineococcus xinjiangensis]PPK98036.1 hypothetical protein CLV92_102189 [Kineococcus xinjiangensis]